MPGTSQLTDKLDNLLQINIYFCWSWKLQADHTEVAIVARTLVSYNAPDASG